MRGPNWTKAEMAEFAKQFASKTNKELAEIFGRTVHAVEVKGSRMNLLKDEEHDSAACGRQQRERADKLGQWATMKRQDGTTLDCTVEIVNGVRITRAKTVLDTRYTPKGPYVGAITGEMRGIAS